MQISLRVDQPSNLNSLSNSLFSGPSFTGGSLLGGSKKRTLTQAHLQASHPDHLDVSYSATCQVDYDHVPKLEQYIRKRKYTLEPKIIINQTDTDLKVNNNQLDQQCRESADVNNENNSNSHDLSVKIGGIFDFTLKRQIKTEKQMIQSLMEKCDQKMHKIKLDQMLFDNWFFASQGGASGITTGSVNSIQTSSNPNINQLNQIPSVMNKFTRPNGQLKPRNQQLAKTNAIVEPVPIQKKYHIFSCSGHINDPHNLTSTSSDDADQQPHHQNLLNPTTSMQMMDNEDSVGNQSSISQQLQLQQANLKQKQYFLVLKEPLPHDVIQQPVNPMHSNNNTSKLQQQYQQNQFNTSYQMHGANVINGTNQNNIQNNPAGVFTVEGILSCQCEDEAKVVQNEEVLVRMCPRFSKKAVSLESTDFYYLVNYPVKKGITYDIYLPKATKQ